jgi:hypothetical protein
MAANRLAVADLQCTEVQVHIRLDKIDWGLECRAQVGYVVPGAVRHSKEWPIDHARTISVISGENVA